MYQHSSGGPGIVAYYDYDWAQESPSQKPISGKVLMLAGGSIPRGTRQQTVVAQSTKEAANVALALCVRDILWMGKLYFVLSGFVDKAALDDLVDATVAEDNQSCMKEAIHPVMQELSKHVIVKYQLTVNHVRKRMVRTVYIETENMAADVMTNALSPHKFKYHIKLLRMK